MTDHIHHFLLESKPQHDGLFHGRCKSCPAVMTAPAFFAVMCSPWNRSHNTTALAKGIEKDHITHRLAMQAAFRLVKEHKRRLTTQLRFGRND